MKKVEITNIVTGVEYSNSKMEDPTEWIAECIANNAWGFGERKLVKQDENPDYPVELVVSETIEETESEYEVQVYEKDAEGNLILEDVTIQDLDGNDMVIQQPIPTGEVEIVPAVMTTFVNLRPEYDIIIEDITAEYELNKRLDETIAIGKKVTALCFDVLDLIIGSNVTNGKTKEEIDQMEIDLDAIATKLERKRFDTAKTMIEALVDPAYNSLKADVLKTYERHGF